MRDEELLGARAREHILLNSMKSEILASRLDLFIVTHLLLCQSKTTSEIRVCINKVHKEVANLLSSYIFAKSGAKQAGCVKRKQVEIMDSIKKT